MGGPNAFGLSHRDHHAIEPLRSAVLSRKMKIVLVRQPWADENDRRFHCLRTMIVDFVDRKSAHYIGPCETRSLGTYGGVQRLQSCPSRPSCHQTPAERRPWVLGLGLGVWGLVSGGRGAWSCHARWLGWPRHLFNLLPRTLQGEFVYGGVSPPPDPVLETSQCQQEFLPDAFGLAHHAIEPLRRAVLSRNMVGLGHKIKDEDSTNHDRLYHVPGLNLGRPLRRSYVRVRGSCRRTRAKRLPRVWGLGFGVWGLGFGVWGLGFEAWGWGFGIWVWGWGSLNSRLETWLATACPFADQGSVRFKMDSSEFLTRGWGPGGGPGCRWAPLGPRAPR